MIEIKAALDEAGILRSCEVSGHAGAGKTGTDIVCAAVSVLLRTAIQVLSGRKGITIRGDAPEPGLLWMEADYSEEGREFLSSTGEFLTAGLKSVAGEFPDNCRFTGVKERRT
jgi:uncharacterized protein YsxB (DUF464 family)